MLDSVYQTVQALMNKEQLGYLKPMSFNLFANNAQRLEYNQLFVDLKLNERKQNWHLDEKDMANLAEHSRQLLEHLSEVEVILGYPSIYPYPSYTIPSYVEFIENVFTTDSIGKQITKVPYSDFKNLQRNIYAAPTDCSPLCAKVGLELKVSPKTITEIEMHYLRKPKTVKWTFVEDAEGKPFYDPTQPDFQDFDLPKTSKDRLIDFIAKMAGVSIRDNTVIQTATQQQAQDAQLDNRQ
ncbi:MAG: hypothetical protein QM499_00900 [Flavobacteriaceae bacterium]